MPSIWDRRLRDLEEHIEKDFALLQEYEDLLGTEIDPKRKAGYRREIVSLKESANRYQQELNEIKSKTSELTETNNLNAVTRLEDMESQIGMLMNTQVSICDFLGNFRQEILNQYSTSERNIIQSITRKLEDDQITTIKFILAALNNNQISELEINQILNDTHETLLMIEQSNVNLSAEQQALAEVFSDPKLDSKHRLKVAIPIIPLLLSYETQIELGSSMNLSSVWQNLKAKFKGN